MKDCIAFGIQSSARTDFVVAMIDLHHFDCKNCSLWFAFSKQEVGGFGDCVSFHDFAAKTLVFFSVYFLGLRINCVQVYRDACSLVH